MTSVFDRLPAPIGNYKRFSDAEEAAARKAELQEKPVFQPPPYGRRGTFVPRKVEHYGDGGAFPECHVAQYPLNMGRPGSASTSNAIVPTYTDKDGVVQYDGILAGNRGGVGGNKNKIHSKFTDLIEKDFSNSSKLVRPADEELEENRLATLRAMNMIVEKKQAAALPVKRPDARTPSASDHEFVRYTPNPSAPGYNPNCAQRIVRIVDVPKDPMEPPKFMHRKVPGGPPEPAVPLMRSPPRKVTAEDQKNWKIPPCISNWKNARGYTIPLDKRLAADGRGLQETAINQKFAKIAEALYQAESAAREEVNYRSKVRQKLKMTQRRQEEEKLLERAKQIREQQAKMERGGADSDSGSDSDSDSDSGSDSDSDSGSGSGSDSDSDSGSSSSGSGSDRERRRKKGPAPPKHRPPSRERERARDGGREKAKAGETREEKEKRMEREAMRLDRKRERERDLRREAMGKRSKLSRDADRDVSERIALGLPTGNAQKQTQYDSRLFNQSSGMDSGFGDESDYNVYNKPLFAAKSQTIYRPRNKDKEIYGTADEQYNELVKTDKFRPEKDFKGVDRSKGTQRRTQPVQYEREAPAGDAKADPFGLDSFVSKTKKKKE